ncbi:hypothetical protein [Actinoplanes sp. NPDC026623]|uniref:hypothetical protein n=1 Tax=Actinoplanes sp. NPDC026623 TaxID=3155610 RepID=UPI0034098B94
MQLRGIGHHGRRFAILCFAVIVALPAGPARSTPPLPVPAVQAGHVHVAASRSAPESALRLQALLGQHSVLAAEFMRGRIRGDENFAQSANAALGRNTDAMAQLLGDVLGAATARRFAELWAQHVVELFTYARGLADQDEKVRDEARQELIEYEEDLAAFFVKASHGRLTTRAANGAMRMHVDHLLAQADAYAAHHYPAADRIYRESYQHTYELGGTIAAAILTGKDAKVLRTPIWRLRSQLGKLLAEHVVLVEDVTRAAITNGPDFSAAGQALNGNTGDLASAVDSLFGAKAAKDFQALWAHHVDQVVAYAAATAAQDSGRREQARRRLRELEVRLAAFLEEATGKRLSSTRLADALLAHDQLLLRHAEAFAAKQYDTALEMALETYEHMSEMAHLLADAFGATVAARLPVGGAATGYGAMAGVVKRR